MAKILASVALASLALVSFGGVTLAKAESAGAGTPPPPAPPAPPADGYDWEFELPASATGTRSTEDSDEAKKIKGLPAPRTVDGKLRKASILIPVTVDAAITDPKERDAAFIAACKTIQNRVAGTIRRHRKIAGNENLNFSVRKVGDDKLGFGVRVWRDEDTAVPPAPAGTTGVAA